MADLSRSVNNRKSWFRVRRQKLRILLDKLFDTLFGIDTVTDTMTYARQESFFRDQKVNGPVSYLLLYKYIDRRQFKPSSDVFVDVGCGHGRVLCYIARRKLHKVVGFEISQEFAERANSNATKLRARKSAIKVHVGDAIHCDYVDGTIFFFGDPFGHQTMKLVLAKIAESLAVRQRPVCCIFWLPSYVDPRVVEAIVSSGWLIHRETRKAFYSPMRAEYWDYNPESRIGTGIQIRGKQFR